MNESSSNTIDFRAAPLLPQNNHYCLHKTIYPMGVTRTLYICPTSYQPFIQLTLRAYIYCHSSHVPLQFINVSSFRLQPFSAVSSIMMMEMITKIIFAILAITKGVCSFLWMDIIGDQKLGEAVRNNKFGQWRPLPSPALTALFAHSI